MPDKAPANEVKPAADATPATAATPAAGAPVVPPRRSPGHRGQDVRDTVAEMAARAHEISLEAGSKMAGALRDVIGAAAGLTGFAVESARDLVQYMVRRGQMSQEDADKLIRDAEEASSKRKGALPPPVRSTTSSSAKPAAEKPVEKAIEKPVERVAEKVAEKVAAAAPKVAPKPAAKPAAAAKPEPKKAAAKPAPTPKPAAKRAGSVKAKADKPAKVAAKAAPKGKKK